MTARTIFSIALAAIVAAFSVKGVLLVYTLDNFVHTPFNNQESHTAQLDGIVHSLKMFLYLSGVLMLVIIEPFIFKSINKLQ